MNQIVFYDAAHPANATANIVFVASDPTTGDPIISSAGIAVAHIYALSGGETGKYYGYTDGGTAGAVWNTSDTFFLTMGQAVSNVYAQLTPNDGSFAVPGIYLVVVKGHTGGDLAGAFQYAYQITIVSDAYSLLTIGSGVGPLLNVTLNTTQGDQVAAAGSGGSMITAGTATASRVTGTQGDHIDAIAEGGSSLTTDQQEQLKAAARGGTLITSGTATIGLAQSVGAGGGLTGTQADQLKAAGSAGQQITSGAATFSTLTGTVGAQVQGFSVPIGDTYSHLNDAAIIITEGTVTTGTVTGPVTLADGQTIGNAASAGVITSSVTTGAFTGTAATSINSLGAGIMPGPTQSNINAAASITVAGNGSFGTLTGKVDLKDDQSTVTIGNALSGGEAVISDEQIAKIATLVKQGIIR